MPQFTFDGVDLDLDWLLSYCRVSSSQQTIEQGGEGIQRQIREFDAFAAHCGVPVDDIGTLVDEGKSGSTGKNVEDGALGTFIKVLKGKAPGKLIKPKTALVVESFSRLSRLPIEEGMGLFLDIIRSGVALITLQHRRAFTRETLRTNKGQIYQVSSEIQAARDLADNISYYSRRSWTNGRRGGASNIVPSWITKTAGGEPVTSVKGLKQTGAVLDLALDPDKLPIVERVCSMALTQGVDQICRILNAEGVPTLNSRKRQRGVELWDKGALLKMLRGRQLLGQQEVAKYVDGKRLVTPGIYTDAYPAVVSEGLWNRIQIALDSRQSRICGLHMGRNVTRMTNLFGDLARCECGERMKVHRRGDRGEYVYLGCSAAYVGGCKAKNEKYFRLDKIEQTVLPKVATEVVDDTPPTDDQAAALRRSIAKAKADAARIEQAYLRSMERTGELAAKTQLKLETDHQAKQAEVTRLERELITLEAASPASELQNVVQRVLDKALAGDVAARSTIAEALPGLIKSLTCRGDGTWRYQSTSGLVAHTFGGKKSGRAAVTKLLDLIPE